MAARTIGQYGHKPIKADESMLGEMDAAQM